MRVRPPGGWVRVWPPGCWARVWPPGRVDGWGMAVLGGKGPEPTSSGCARRGGAWPLLITSSACRHTK